MKILHYALGFPPYRTGGLTKFCCDLMQQQRKMGHEVAMLWPGRMNMGKPRVRKDGEVGGIASWELVNPLPVPYDEGILATQAFMADVDEEIFRELLQGVQVLHVHTLMGLPESLLVIAGKMGVQRVFTTHDFFPICPKVTMFRGGDICPTAKDCKTCTACNATALPMWKMKLLQAPLYRRLKDSSVMKRLRRSHRDSYFAQNAHEQPLTEADGSAYLALRSHYRALLGQIDTIHYNSTISRQVFKTYLNTPEGIVIPVSHKDIRDNRVERSFSDAPLRITYLGQPSGAKGWFVLKCALDQLYTQGKNFRLNIFFSPSVRQDYMTVHKRYDYAALPEIFRNTDILVCPSVWYETFGYTVLEAASFGVPAVVSNRVGALDILPEGAAVVVKAGDAQALARALQDITAQKLEKIHALLQNARIWSMEDVAQALQASCYRKENPDGTQN